MEILISLLALISFIPLLAGVRMESKPAYFSLNVLWATYFIFIFNCLLVLLMVRAELLFYRWPEGDYFYPAYGIAIIAANLCLLARSRSNNRINFLWCGILICLSLFLIANILLKTL